jgi:hypothetical protein
VINTIFQIIETFSPLIPLIVFLAKRFKKFTGSKLLLLYLIIYIFLSFCANLFPFIHRSNILIYVIISILTILFFALILEQFLPQKFKMLNGIVISLTILFIIVNAIWGEGSSIFNSYSSVVANLVLVSYCVYYYKWQLEKPQIIFVEKVPSFWIVSGIFIYSAGNIFLFSMFSSLTRNNPGFAYYAWDINIILILIMNILFAKGIQCNWQK